ncbi:hypothetical protein UNDYM_0995 [Undibacterium sp. YM2]|jgi:hypothetical protein|uniref:hypothetical protein n=1 Tax=Undibacterium sp. YM2 TaxID=2058625 RepID=UPI001331D9DB|nr:hypothetical protein [Undibacterium sp. YM2]BBB65248.1 hypothetical protein UNDYM_0995 [Undibacterium sp. YM2]
MKYYLLLLLAAIPGQIIAEEVQQVEIAALRNAEWGSYRHAYKAYNFFATYTRDRPLIQAHMQLRPSANARDISMTGLRLQLSGEKTRLDIAVDAMGRVSMPMLKQAYDEDAVLRLNRPQGQFYFSGRYSIKEREDGIYDLAELRTACEQLISAQRESGYRIRLIGKKCAGIKFIYALNDNKNDSKIAISFRDAVQQPRDLPLSEGQPFEDDSMGKYRVALYKFSDWPASGKIIATSKPLAIGTLYD